MQYVKDLVSFKSRIEEKSMYEWVTIKTSYCDWIKIIMFFSVLDTIFKIKIPRDAKKFIKIPLDTSIKIFSCIPFLKSRFLYTVAHKSHR